MKKLVVGAAVLSAAMCGFAMVGPKDYVRDGLVALYDGIYNAKDASGAMTHDAAATSWANLVLGTGDVALPSEAVVAENSVMLPSVTASAPDCSCARLSPITLEACVMSTSTVTGTEKPFVTIPGRALVGYDARASYGITVAAINGTNWGNSKMKYYGSGKWEFQPYALSVHVISYASTINNAGVVYADGEQQTTPTSFYTSGVVAAPTGELTIGNATVDYTYHCVRVYSRALTADEAKLNAAIDAVRYQNADPATVSLPEGWSFDDETNLVSTAWAGQHRITTPGTVTFTAPHTEAKTLVNAAFGPVTLDESAQAKDADHAISFVGFDAIEQTTSLFKGGWWDFGAGDFFSSTSIAGHRTTVFDGAVVTNVGTVHVAGTGGADNRIDLVNGAEFYPASMTLGWKNGADQRSKVTVSGGSLLSVAGKLNMSDTVETKTVATLTGNELVVSNAGSRLVVGGTFNMAQASTGDASYGAPGGNHFVVTDNAVADLRGVSVSPLNYYNISNRITVAKGGRLTTTSISVGASASYSSGVSGSTWNLLEVLDGGVWTNTGSCVFGQYQFQRHNYQTLLISNGTFYTEMMCVDSNNNLGWFKAPYQQIIISGPEAVFVVGRNPTKASCLFYEVGTHSALIVENGAKWRGPTVNLSNNSVLTDDALIVRTGGELTFPNSLWTGMASVANQGTCGSVDCAFRAESDGVLRGTSVAANGLRGAIVADNGRIEMTGSVTIGHWKAKAGDSYQEPGSNCVLRLSGDHPSVKAANVTIVDKSKNFMVFDLPATGYLETHACSTQAVVNASTAITFGSDSILTLNGAEELAAHQEEVRKNAKYVLLSAPTLTIPDEVLAAAQATLPERCKLRTRTVEGKKELVLAVSAGLGLTLIVR